MNFNIIFFILALTISIITIINNVRNNPLKEWRKDGLLHRENGPARIFYGEKSWYFNGRRHRLNGPAIEFNNGYKAWFFNGEPHREDGPALEFGDGSKAWYINGKLHRLDGPAFEGLNNVKFWFYHGEEINCQSQKDFERCIKLLAFK